MSPLQPAALREDSFDSPDSRSEAPSVPHVVNALGVSRRLLELRFREIIGEPVGATILRLRLERLARRLRETTGTMSKVCQSCGFRNLAYAKAAFKRRYGMTMGAWRAR